MGAALCCCSEQGPSSGTPPKGPRQRSGHRSRRRTRHKPALDTALNGSINTLAGNSVDALVVTSLAANSCYSVYHDCKEDFSSLEGASPRISGSGSQSLNGHSKAPMGSSSGNNMEGVATSTSIPRHSPSQQPSHMTHSSGQIPGTALGAAAHTAAGAAATGTAPALQGNDNSSEYESDSSSSEDLDAEPSHGKPGPVVGCLSILDSIRGGPSSPHTHRTAEEEGPPRAVHRSSSRGPVVKPDAGCTLKRRSMSVSAVEARECWEEADPTSFMIRSIDYMKSKVKVHSGPAIYKLAATDFVSYHHKTLHVAKSVNLPPAPAPKHLIGPDLYLPPVLIFNIQLPTYPATFFGSQDGPCQSIVHYFVLPDDFDPATFENQKALALLKRFVANGKEADGTPSRDRLKLIPRVVNTAEWQHTGPLSTAEAKLMVAYHDKPVLSRPQHYFYQGANYLEVDLDIHNYAFLARKAITSFQDRLKEVVYDVAYVLQGNAPDELPEQILGCGRIYRTDFNKHRALHHFIPQHNSAGQVPMSSSERMPAGSGDGALPSAT